MYFGVGSKFGGCDGSGESCSRSRNSDCTSQSNDESDEADNDGRNVKFGQGKK